MLKSRLPEVWLWLLTALPVMAGCGSSAPQPVAAGGRVVTENGQPCDGALVVFHPSEKERQNDAKPVATTSADGSFTLTTTREGDGALPGAYGVTIVWNKPSPDKKLSLSSEGGGAGTTDRLQGRYGDPRKPQIEVQVADPGPNTFEFKVK